MFKLNPGTVAAAVVLGGSLSSLPAQHLNTTLLKNWKRTSTVYNDVWGMTVADGSEFAFVGESRSTWVINATNPRVPTTMAVLSAPSCTWRDFTSVGNFVYSVSQCHAGIRVFEMVKSASGWSVRDHGYKQTSRVRSAHNIRSDPATGNLYVVGGNNRGLAIFDTRSPASPVFLAVWSTLYVHDACIRRGRAYVANGGAYRTTILNITNPASISTIGTAFTAAGYNHACWVSEDDQILCIADEIQRNGVTPHMTVWDISNPSSPVKRGDYDLGGNSIAHNVFVVGRTAYMSYYFHGFHMIDLGDPTRPTVHAIYDTSTYTSGYNGAWGVYPFQDSGTIYVSDRQNGFFAVQVDCGHLNRFGQGTAGTKGVPRVRLDGEVPKVNAPKLRFELEKLEPSRNFWLVVSASSGAGTVLGANVHVNVASGATLGPFTADSSGNATINTPVPNAPGLGGAQIYFQVFGDGGNGQLISSRGMKVGICR